MPEAKTHKRYTKHFHRFNFWLAIAIALCASFFSLRDVAELWRQGDTGSAISGVVLWAFFLLPVIMRLAIGGLYLTDRYVIAVNFLTHKRIPWEEISHFSVENTMYSRLAPYKRWLLVIHRKSAPPVVLRTLGGLALRDHPTTVKLEKLKDQLQAELSERRYGSNPLSDAKT